MNSLKTGVIIAFGLTVLYGVYLVINKPQPSAEAKAEAEAVEDLSIGELDEADEAADVAHSVKEHDHKAHHAASDETLEGDETSEKPEAEVAARDKKGTRFSKSVEAEAEPTESMTDKETDGGEDTDELESDAKAAKLSEAAVAPWRSHKKDSAADVGQEEVATPEETTAGQSEAPVAKRSRFRDEETNENADIETDSAHDKEMPAADTEQEPKAEVKIAPRNAPALGPAEFDAAWTKMEQEIEDSKFKEALTTISPFFHATDISEDDYKQLLEVLDLLAWRVVFSKEHFLAKPHIVAAGETLDDIAAQYEVPAEVLAKINGIKSTKLLTAGNELKVLPGPFRAEVSTERGELTLFLGELYATRYAIESGTEPPPMPGEYVVKTRTPGATYPTIENREIPAQDPRNPYGGVYLGLGDDQCIHGSPEKEMSEPLGTGCMRLKGKDAKEVYWLLSKGSKVTVLR